MLIISNKLGVDFKDFLKDQGIEFLETLDNPSLDPRVADHPDLSIFPLDRETLVVADEVFSYYKERLPAFNLIRGGGLGERYPKDALYNLVTYKNFYIHNDFTEGHIEEGLLERDFSKLFVSQGYTRCSLLNFGDCLLTADYGIYKALRGKVDIDLLPRDDIPLPGFPTGFLGGTFGRLPGGVLLFNGDIKKLKAYDIIRKRAEEGGQDLLFPSCDLIDRGSLISIGD